jgi:hypothetical protein
MLERLKTRLKSAISRIFGASGVHIAADAAPPGALLVAGRNLPVYIDKNLHPCFKQNRAPVPHRVFIITIPKSGTYLIAKILANLGMVDCDVHIAIDHIQDNRFADEKVLRMEAWRYYVPIPFKVSARLIKNGQFSFGHIPYYLEGEQILGGFKKVFTFREMRDVIISLVRYYDSREQNYAKPERIKLYNEFKQTPMGNEKFKAWYVMWGKEFADLITNMFPWKDRGDVFQVKFETLMGDDGKEAQFSMLKGLGGFLGLDITDDEIAGALSDSIGAETLTYSGKRSSYKDWWNGELEDLFTQYGFKELNKRYGYE